MFSRRANRSFWLLLLPLVGLPIGCSKSMGPLSNPDTATVDERLIGVWLNAAGDAKSPLFIDRSSLPNAPAGEMNLGLVSLFEDGVPIRFHNMSFFVSHIGEWSYMNFGWSSDEPKELHYTFWRYHVEGDQLTVWMMMDHEVVASAIEKGELKGTVGKHSASIEDTTENVRDFVMRTDPNLLFHFKVVFKRVKVDRQ